MEKATKTLVETYYRALNTQDWDTLLSLLVDDVVLDIDEGRREVSKGAFAEFIKRFAACCREQISNIHIMINPEGCRAAVEYTVAGVYIADFHNLPPASGQTYRLLGGAFFDIRSGKIARISCYRNFQDWAAQLMEPNSSVVSVARQSVE